MPAAVIIWFAAQVGSIGVLLVEFLLTVILAAALYANGEHATTRLVRFGRRLAGPGGENAVLLAAQTIRGVALGLVVTALAQTVWGGLGLMFAGVPFAGILTAVMLLLSYCPDRGCSSSRACGGLALLGRSLGLGNVLACLDDRGNYHG